MPSGTNSYAFCADYSNIAACLFAIQTSEENGVFAGDAQLLKLLRLFEKDVLRKLYLRTLKVLKNLDAVGEPIRTLVGGDFINKDFTAKDFFTGYWILTPPEGETDTDYLLGDFEDEYFTYLDFYVGYLDTRNTGYSSIFQTILNIFGEFCRRSTEISDADKAAINEALIPVLDAFENLQNYLINAGLNPCVTSDLSLLNNTPGVYLQVAGADGTDGIAEGIHLRWSFTGELGANHFPKGDYDTGSAALTGFNQQNDFIHISRIPYVNQARFAIDFEQSRAVVNFQNRQWTYLINQTFNDQQVSNRIRLKFIDINLYDQLAVTIDPETSSFNFLQQYTGVIELEVVNKKSFLVGFDFRRSVAAESAVLKVEGFCELGTEEDTELIRKTIVLDSGTASTTELIGDNIKTLKIKKFAAGYLQGFYFETYGDFLSTRNVSEWVTVGNGFALSLADDQVYGLLENQNYPVDNLWPQYNNGTKVRISNYKDKWSVTHPNEPSLKEIVTTYLELSETDPRAEDVIKDTGSGEDVPGLLISYLDILNLYATDYHMARMLGLGFIDTPIAAAADQFIYRLTYTNRKSLTDAVPVNYSYLSLPGSKANKLLPEKPSVRPVTYQLPVTDNEINNVFDAQGYTSMDNIRLVNIGREPFNDELVDYDFFKTTDVTNINVFEHPKPILYGVEYRSANQSAYVKPEITSEKAMGFVYNAYDDSYPSAGVPETVPVPDDQTSLYIHFEREAGVHLYAIYGISLFARASLISDEVTTDATIYPVKNALIPPTDVTVQYIQKEEALVFTTSAEQNWLKGRSDTFPGQDISFTRVTFSWLDIIDISNFQHPAIADLIAIARADKMKAFFKPGLPLEITGLIRDIIPVTGSDRQLLIHTGSYSTIDGLIISPSIDPADFFKFKDSLLTVPDGQYRVVEISSGTDWPVITIEKALEISAIDDETDPGIYGAQKTYSLPDIGNRFSMVENLSQASGWQPVAESITLINFSDSENPVIESVADAEGNISKYWIGGINADAIVIPLFSAENGPDDLPGYYKVTFSGNSMLPAHPQVNIPFDPAFPGKNSPGTLHEAHVEWYKGVVRMSLQTGGADKKLLQVAFLDQSTADLVLYVYDPDYLNAPIGYSGTGTEQISVNFHPGYKVYLFPEPAPDHMFNDGNISPADDASNRKTLLGLQSADTRPAGTGFVSGVSLPVVLLARKIEEPVQFDAPDALVLKVRPDATGKAAFTFDMRIKPAVNGTLRKPFGFRFHRTTHEDVLRALYAPETVAQIFSDLAAITVDPSFNLRFLELVNLVFDPQDLSKFRVFDATPHPYGFPEPDKPALSEATGDQTVKYQLYHNAIIGTLLPLTEQTPVFNYIKQGLQTENKLPVIRDIDGNLLSPSDPAFNPYPMIRKYTKDSDNNSTYIRFTDYILNGSSRGLYFYAGVEMTNELIPGVLSPFTGPVTILQTSPSAAPVIRRFSLSPATAIDEQTSVTFSVAPMSPSDHISKIRVYSTTDPNKAGIIQMITTWFDVEIEEGAPEGYEITDDFTGRVVPVGQTVYYSLAGIRTIINEFEESEEVLSEASKVITLKFIDTINPLAPDLTYVESANELTWQPTTTNGTYYLFQQNSKGNWAKIYTVQPPDTADSMEYTLPQPLLPLDEDGNRIYYRFKVQAQNSSGLLNLTEKELAI